MNEKQLKYFGMDLGSRGFNVNEKGVYITDKLHALVLKKGGEMDMRDVAEIQKEARIKFDKKEDCDA